MEYEIVKVRWITAFVQVVVMKLQTGDGQYRGSIRSGMQLLQILLVHAMRTPLYVCINTF